MLSDEESQHVTLAQAAEWLGMAPTTLERWAGEGRIPSTVTADGLRTFPRSELLKLAIARNDDAGRGV